MRRVTEVVVLGILLALFCLAIGGQAAGQSPKYQREEERLNEFDRAARSIGRLERRIDGLDTRVKRLEDQEVQNATR